MGMSRRRRTDSSTDGRWRIHCPRHSPRRSHLVRADSKGKILWDKTVGHLRCNIQRWHNCRLGIFHGRRYSGNSTSCSMGTGDAFLIKCDSSGNELWEEYTVTLITSTFSQRYKQMTEAFVLAGTFAIAGIDTIFT